VAPEIVRSVDETRQRSAAARAGGQRIGLVPTMGALHAGHASLIRAARRETGFVVVSIFVNPTQFGPREDLARYPRPLEKDAALCAEEGVNLIFHPEPGTMYSPGYNTYVEVHKLQDVLCGAARPGHFRGVATVVLKLLNITQPDMAYLGQKDAQQARIIEQMVRDLDVPVALRIIPIVREADGLALSSRNVYLSAEERRHATVLYRTLEEIGRLVKAGQRRAAPLLALARDEVARTPGARLDYAAIVDRDRLQPVERLHGEVLIALAVYFGATRLIDNIILQVED
jgi:pantoate--beta-alanine ligase